MTKLTGLAYLLEHAEFATKESREKTEARIKPLLDYARKVISHKTIDLDLIDDIRTLKDVSSAIDGDHQDRRFIGMEPCK